MTVIVKQRKLIVSKMCTLFHSTQFNHNRVTVLSKVNRGN